MGFRQIAARTVPVLLSFFVMEPFQVPKSQASLKLPRVLKGEIRLTEDLRVTAPRIVLEEVTLFTAGNRLEFLADEVLEVRGFATIRAFDAKAPRAPGESGRSAGLIAIRARRSSGPHVRIDNSGEDGAAGMPGLIGAPGKLGRPGVVRDWNPWAGCAGGKDGQPGEPGGPGGDGGPGGAGGNGGVVLLSLRAGAEEIALKATANGGRGGSGGPPGPGGPGGIGGAGAPGISTCGGTAPGPPGARGPDGRAGIRGADGNPGSILDVNDGKKHERP